MITDFGSMIIMARVKADMTQREFAEALGIDVKIINAIENNRLEGIPDNVMNTLGNVLNLDKDTIKLWNDMVKDLGSVMSGTDVKLSAYKVEMLSFSQALEAMKQGECVSRIGWNGKGMYIYITSAKILKKQVFSGEGPDPLVNSTFIAMKTVTGHVMPWLANHSDLLSEDWYVVDAGKGQSKDAAGM